MNAKALERLIADRGGNASAFGVVVRTLRAAFHVSTSGRGIPHDLSPDDGAWVLAAYAGSEIAARADHTFGRLLKLQSDASTNNRFVFKLQLILRRDSVVPPVREVRICRNLNLAVIVYQDGREERFTAGNGGDVPAGGFRSEGILSGELLDVIARNFSEDRTSDADELAE